MIRKDLLCIIWSDVIKKTGLKKALPNATIERLLYKLPKLTAIVI
jgi:hypothetical protein